MRSHENQAGRDRGVIKETRNYDLFCREEGNRVVNLKTHQARILRHSMSRSGWLKSCPAVVVRRDGKNFLKDGQHRLAIAKELGIPVSYVIDEAAKDLDVAEFNNSSRSWGINDYIARFAELGNKDYIYLQNFIAEKGITPKIAVELLDCSDPRSARLTSGRFRAAKKDLANVAADTYLTIREICPIMKAINITRAIAACCLVDCFDPQQLIRRVRSRAAEIRAIPSTKDGALDMLEELYNKGSRKRVPLAFLAREAFSKGAASQEEK